MSGWLASLLCIVGASAYAVWRFVRGPDPEQEELERRLREREEDEP